MKWFIIYFVLASALMIPAWRSDNPDKRAVVDTFIMNTLRTEIDTVKLDGEYRAVVTTTDSAILIKLTK